MSGDKFDLLIIGGGISGCAVAHDAASRGLKVALVEKTDYGCATSAATSKLAHGGLRYLKNLEFGLVRESLRERRTLEYIAPHLVYPVPFMIPNYRGTGTRRSMIWAAMLLYDLLSWDKGNLEDPDRRSPGRGFFNRQSSIDLEPGMSSERLSGSSLYYDCQMYSPDRVTLEFLLSAEQNGAQAANYAKVVGFIKQGNRVQGAVVQDSLSDQTYEIRAEVTANTCGPWADIVLGLATDGKNSHGLLRSQGIHIITRSISNKYAMVLATRSGRHFFIIPWRGHSLIGTTDTKYEDAPDEYSVSESAVAEFIDEINDAYPGGKLTREDVLWSYGGLRPIVDKQTEVEGTYSASRKYEIYDDAKENGIEGHVTVIGGKYTTSRNLARSMVDMVGNKLGRELPPCRTDQTRLFGGDIPTWAGFLADLKREHPHGLSGEQLEHLARLHGSALGRVLAHADADPSLLEPIGPGRLDLKCEVVHAVREEMAQTLADVLMRRTEIGTAGDPGAQALETCAELTAAELGWDEQRKAEELAAARDEFSHQGIKPD
ncbi:MAG: glycerol-3-phosphate dehydrogenase/oxidase [Candidatus Alcyoniella australis]|nr:glycerol-3-phosphate dehydrogenase/oxidase [Candidatus Alcyoniella australis]